MVPRPSSRFPRMLKHADESPLHVINHLLRSPRLKAWRQCRHAGSADGYAGCSACRRPCTGNGNSVVVVRLPTYSIQMACRVAAKRLQQQSAARLTMPPLTAEKSNEIWGDAGVGSRFMYSDVQMGIYEPANLGSADLVPIN